METKIKEIWKDVDHKYKISSHGRVFSKITNKILLTPVNSAGYPLVGLSGKSIHVHRLVAKSFIPNPLNKPQVNHIDGDKTNNNVHNLEWVDQSENQLHAYKLGLQKPCEAQKLGVSLHAKENYSKEVSQFTINGVFVAKYYSASEAARITGADQSNISATCRGKLKKHYNYVWRYT